MMTCKEAWLVFALGICVGASAAMTLATAYRLVWT